MFVWNYLPRLATNRLTGLFERLGSPTFALSGDGRRLVAVTTTGLGAWDAQSLQPIAKPVAADPPLRFVQGSNAVLVLREPSTLLRWNLDTGQTLELARLPAPFSQTSDCALSPSGRWIAFGDEAGKLHLGDASTGRSAADPRPHLRYVLALGFSHTETFLASADLSGDAFLWSVPGLNQLGVLRGHKDYVRGLAISPDATRLATASADGTARVWRVPECVLVAVLRGHNEDVIDAAFSPDGLTLATSSYDRTVRLWHLATLREMVSLPHPDRVLRIQFSKNGTLLAAMCQDGTMQLWHAPLAPHAAAPLHAKRSALPTTPFDLPQVSQSNVVMRSTHGTFRVYQRVDVHHATPADRHLN